MKIDIIVENNLIFLYIRLVYNLDITGSQNKMYITKLNATMYAVKSKCINYVFIICGRNFQM